MPQERPQDREIERRREGLHVHAIMSNQARIVYKLGSSWVMWGMM